MDSNHRFDVKTVSEDIEVPNSGVLDLGHGHATYPGSNSDLKNRRSSLAQITREALPHLDHYSNCQQAVKRPSLGELHGESNEEKVRPLCSTM